MKRSSHVPGPIPCEGAVFDDFRLTDSLPPEAAPAVIERDRLIMAARPGFERKLLPLRVEPETGTAYSGGRYLLDTYENAVAFADWCGREFEIDGVLILERPDFAEVTAHVWHVIGAHDFKDIHTAQHVYRTEIWKMAQAGAGDRLASQWPALRDRAEEEGRSALWLLYNDARREASLVTIAARTGTPPKGQLDFASLRALERAPSFGEEWVRSGAAAKTFDRTHWVFTIWFPNTGDERAEAPLWPNSPPLPAPGAAVRRSAA
jgi:hypothetical protein